MEGPTPVSALIHAATMVAAGVYLLARIFFLLNPSAMIFIASIGAITAFMGAVSAINQHDIKKVLAFSTISQLGFMVMGIGVGAYEAALFHLITHAFFKACLFLCAGAVIYSLHQAEHKVQHLGVDLHFDAQDMRIMGGLRKRLPYTFWTYAIAASALAGLPLFSGFLSKDAILTGAVSWASVMAGTSVFFYIIPLLGFIAAFLTAFYIGRQLFLVFFGKLRLLKQSESISVMYIAEVPWLMRIPLITLGFLSMGFVFSLNPIDAAQSWVFPFLQNPGTATPDGFTIIEQEWLLANTIKYHYIVLVASIFLAISGVLLSWMYYGRNEEINKEYLFKPTSSNFIGRLSYNNWFLDDIYKNSIVSSTLNSSQWIARFDKKVIDKFIEYIGIINVVLAHLIVWFDKAIVDGIINLGVFLSGKVGGFTRSFQQGSVQAYLIYSLIGAIILIAWIII
ncbi:MAG: NADH-quinone oxidoreductase subunit L, partial [Bacteroidota bacterium]|nr:NADH-quinone oxidoreductase subunit L [Bacteroidota bacterium]